jgi:hypothetical protein
MEALRLASLCQPLCSNLGSDGLCAASVMAARECVGPRVGAWCSVGIAAVVGTREHGMR